MSILNLLKEETRPEHHALEKALNLLRPDFTIDDYVHVLERFYGIYKPLEMVLPIPPERLKTSHLEKDLKHFGIDVSQIETTKYLTDTSGPNQQYGIRYVLEGSTLGGQVLLKHFKEKFYISPDSGCFFFSGYGDKTMLMWKEFQNELLEFSESTDYNQNAVIESAKNTFLLLHHWLIPSK